MPMFHWNGVEALRNYARGSIVVEAEDAEMARAMARDHAMAWLKEHREFWFMHDGISIDEDSREDYEKWVAQLDVDLDREPEQTGVIYFPGSS